jgi:hypothetical protein
MNEQEKQYLETMKAFGLLMETSKLIYNEGLRVGYTEEQSFELAKIPLQELSSSLFRKNDKE